MWKATTIFAALVVLVLSVLQPEPVVSPETFSAPPSVEPFLFGAAGDRRVAADLVWLAIVQRLGNARYVDSGLPELEEWVDIATQLDPQFESAYFVAATFLTALPDRATQVDRLLARGSVALPDSPMMPMARGFVHYFGVYEPGVAADYFREAAAKGAPAYLNSLAERLTNLSTTCRTVGEDLNALQHGLGASKTQARLAAYECSRRLIERGAAAERLRSHRNVTLEELRQQGMLRGLVNFPGECWHLEEGKASLKPCP